MELIILTIIIFSLAALFYLRVKLFRLNIKFLEGPDLKARKPFLDLSAIIHFHTAYSDGSMTLGDVIKIARSLKADIAVSSDHNTLKPRYDGAEGYYNGLFYFAGEEINTNYGHLLALGVREEIERGDYERVLENIKKQNAISVICHPHNWWTPWKNFDVTGYDGIEVINLDSQWRGMNPFYIFIVFLTYWINPFYAMHFLAHKPKKTIKFWDNVQRGESMKAGIASIDAHSNVKITKKIRVKFPKYEELFSVSRTHILLGEGLSGKNEEIEKDIEKVTAALKSGKCYFSFDMFGSPKGFYFEAVLKNQVYSSGDAVHLYLKDIDNKDESMIVYSGIRINPKANPFIISLFLNGQKLTVSGNTDLKYEIPFNRLEELSQKYRSLFLRIEVDVLFGWKKITYLYSNNIGVIFRG